MIKTIAPLLLSIVLFSCSNKTCLYRIKYFLNSSTQEERGKYLSEDYHSYFAEKTGNGKDKTAALKSFMSWDAPLHPDITILKYTVKNNKWKVEFNEQSDFTKLIGFPGWKGTELFTFNSKRQIREMTYIPNDENPDYKKWLQPAIDWLQKNKHDELNEVYQSGKLVQTNETAKKWVSLLQL